MSQPDDPLLRELRGPGQPESAGRFTVDAAAARKVLTHAFADPHMYVLPFVASAVLSGATRVSVRTQRTGLEILHDGDPLTKQELEQIAQDPLRRDTRTPAGRAALAWNAALQLRPKRLHLDSGGFRLADDGGLHDLQEAEPGVRLLLKRTFSLREPPELRYLRERTWPAPVRLEVDGRPLDLHAGWEVATACTGGPSRTMPDLLPRTEEPFSFLLALDTAVPWRDGIAFVVDGVLFVLPDVDLGVPQAVALVAADGIAFDLSWSAAVENAASEAVIEALRPEAARLEERLVLHTAPTAATPPVLQRMHRHFRRRGDLPRLHPVVAELVRRGAESPRLLASVQLKGGLIEEACATLAAALRTREPGLAADFALACQALDPRVALVEPTAETPGFFARLAAAADLESVRALKAEARDRDERASAADHETAFLLLQGLDALASAQEALERDRALHGLTHLETSGSAAALAVVQSPRQTAELLQQALAPYGPRHPERGELLACASALAAAGGDWRQAAILGRQALQAMPPSRAMIWGDYQGYVEWRAGRPAEALGYWWAAAELRRRPPPAGLPTRPPGPPRVQITLSHRGWFTTASLLPPLRLTFPPPEVDRLPDALEEASRRAAPDLAAALRQRAEDL